MSVYRLAMPMCVQSRPIAAKTWPRASDLSCQLMYPEEYCSTHFVIVPSMSEMTIWSVSSHRKMRAETTAMPEYELVTEN